MGGIKRIADAIAAFAGRLARPVRLMEVCGTHTVAVFRHGIRELLPENISLLSGPGCPVCVTAQRDVDAAIAYARTPGVTLATFGDMMRVPGGAGSLNEARAGGARVKVVYSPLDALAEAEKSPTTKVVFFATGFETTSPLVAATLRMAEEKGVGNFFVHTVHKLVPPALRALLVSGEAKVDGFILPGHVSAIIGSRPYGFLAAEFGAPAVITGFGAEDILEGVLMLMGQIASGRPQVETQYKSVVRDEGNPAAVRAIHEYFEPADANWRGIGIIPKSGLALRPEKKRFDAVEHIKVEVKDYPEPGGCSCGEVLRGLKAPTDCALFGRRCTPEQPVGACMVSTEGSCAAYYRYGRL